MTNISESPWLLLIAAIVVAHIVFIYRKIFYEKRRFWQLLLPVVIALAALSIDYFVKTDREKISAVLQFASKAVQNNTPDQLSRVIASDYADSFHYNREKLLDHSASSQIPGNIKKCKSSIASLNLQSDQANILVASTVTLERDSRNPEMFVDIVKVNADIELKKIKNEWLITSIELRKINNLPVKWFDITY